MSKTIGQGRQNKLSPEERIERWRKTVGFFLGPAIFFGLLLLPLDLEPKQHAMAAIMAFVVTYWASEALPIPVTAIVGLALCVLLNVPPVPEGGNESPADVVFPYFSSSTVFLFIGGFILAQAMVFHGLNRRFAFLLLSLPGVARSTYGIIIAFGAAGTLMSAFISNSAAAAMLTPIGIGIVNALAGVLAARTKRAVDPKRLRFSTALMLMIAYGANIGGLITPIGNPSNMIGLSFIEKESGTTVSFLQWVAIAFPIVLVMFVVLCVILLWMNPPEIGRINGVEELIAEERRKLGPLSRGEVNTLIAFLSAAIFWILPGILGPMIGNETELYQAITHRIDKGVVAILAAGMLFVLPVNWSERRFTLTWSEAAKIDWGTILLFGSGIALGALMNDTGLAKTLGVAIADAAGASSLLSITILAAFAAVLMSEMASNTASASIVVPIVFSLAASVGAEPLLPAFVVVFASAFGFMVPVSSASNAIVYGSEMVPITAMIRSGFLLDLIGPVIVLIGLNFMMNFVGLL